MNVISVVKFSWFFPLCCHISAKKLVNTIITIGCSVGEPSMTGECCCLRWVRCNPGVERTLSADRVRAVMQQTVSGDSINGLRWARCSQVYHRALLFTRFKLNTFSLGRRSYTTISTYVSLWIIYVLFFGLFFRQNYSSASDFYRTRP